MTRTRTAPAAASSPKAKAQLLLELGEGLISESFPRGLSNASQGGTNGQIVFTAVPLTAGDVVTGVEIDQNNSPTTATLFKVGLYDATFTRVAVSNDLSATFNGSAAGVKQWAFTGPYTVPTTGIYYVAWIQVGSTVVMSYSSFSGNLSNQYKAVGTGKALMATLNAQADLGVGPLAPTTVLSNWPWGGVY